FRKAIAVSTPLVFVPARAQTADSAPMTHHVYRRGDLGEQRRASIAVAGHHLADLDTAGVAGQACCDRPGFKTSFNLWRGNRMEMVEDPDRVETGLLCHKADASHGLILLDWIVDFDQVHAPALGHERAELDNHLLLLYL